MSLFTDGLSGGLQRTRKYNTAAFVLPHCCGFHEKRKFTDVGTFPSSSSTGAPWWGFWWTRLARGSSLQGSPPGRLQDKSLSPDSLRDSSFLLVSQCLQHWDPKDGVSRLAPSPSSTLCAWALTSKSLGEGDRKWGTPKVRGEVPISPPNANYLQSTSSCYWMSHCQYTP